MKTLTFSSVVLAGLLAACGSKKTSDVTTTTTAADAPAATAPAAPAETPAAAPATAAAPAATFDINTVPISAANLGGFPYLSKLPGYKINVSSDSVAFDFDRTYVYDGKGIVPVEGRVLRREYIPVNADKKTSDLMIQRNYENLVKSLGGVQVSSAALPVEPVDKMGREEFNKHSGGIDPGNQVDTYVIRQKDKEVWVQVSPDGYHYKLNVTERAAMPQQATTVPAAELKKN
ncbi:hypothetical protein ACFQ48_17980 [Hymenobacter caeli]|uniref:Uncharacterized protein n=1 Tax=Hymenobacter caeli TaxID=2735894 RepID=A0ABX2FUN6_9BACT|nr:hypothetical protein [Hymenobacter caeli]NRT20903.1 hypothetical protein [Hymenobacter caeli]